MKTHKHLYSLITEFENLHLAFKRAANAVDSPLESRERRRVLSKGVISMIKAGTADRLSLGHKTVSECARRAQGHFQV